MRPHLGGWQRLGIVASVVWMIVAGIWQWESGLRLAEDMYISTYRPCTERLYQRTPNPDLTDCNKQAERIFAEERIQAGVSALFVSLGPIPFAWLFIYIAVKVWRWVRRGYSSSHP